MVKKSKLLSDETLYLKLTVISVFATILYVALELLALLLEISAPLELFQGYVESFIITYAVSVVAP